MDHTPPPTSAPSAEATNANWAAAVWHQALAPHTAGLPAVIGLDEQGRRRTLNWPTLRQQAASLALALQDMGLQSGDVVALYLPHVPEVVVAMVACASMGVVCSHCHPLLETAQVLDRWRGLRPKVLLGADGLYWGGQPHDRAHTLHELRIALPSLQQLVVWRTPYAAERVYGATDLGTLCARDNTATQAWVPVAVPAQHPLWLEHRTTDDLALPPKLWPTATPTHCMCNRPLGVPTPCVPAMPLTLSPNGCTGPPARRPGCGRWRWVVWCMAPPWCCTTATPVVMWTSPTPNGCGGNWRANKPVPALPGQATTPAPPLRRGPTHCAMCAIWNCRRTGRR